MEDGLNESQSADLESSASPGDKVTAETPPRMENAKTDESYKEPLSSVMEITVSESERRYNGAINLNEYYTAYLIETRVTDPAFHGAPSRLGALWRRYSEFETLAGYLAEAYPFVVVPPLPEKRASHVWQKLATDPLDSEFIDRRRVGLESFLLRVASHPILSWDPIFMRFIQDERDWKEIVTGTGYLEKVERQLKSLNATIRVKKGDSRFDELLSYGKELETHLTNVLRSRARLTDATHAIRRQHANYGRVLSEWSAIETRMGDGLQRAGHYMDAHAASIDAFIEEEEVTTAGREAALASGRLGCPGADRGDAVEPEVVRHGELPRWSGSGLTGVVDDELAVRLGPRVDSLTTFVGFLAGRHR